jgi:hypothetical protein
LKSDLLLDLKNDRLNFDSGGVMEVHSLTAIFVLLGGEIREYPNCVEMLDHG